MDRRMMMQEAYGLPAEYTGYDYIWALNQSIQQNIYTNDLLNTATYENLNVLGCEFDYLAVSGHTTVPLFGGRPVTGNAKSYAFYPQTNALGYHLHGNDSEIKPTATDGVVHHVIYTNTSASPSSLQVDSDSPVSITWKNNNVINKALSLLSNPFTTPTAVSRGVQIGRIKLTDMEGNIVGDYIPCVRNADNVIGIYDAVGREFHTAMTVESCTIGASQCKYAVGYWG